MAISIIGPNLNQWGDSGQFETDPSTWGFGPPSVSGYPFYFSLTKSSADKTAGLNSCELINPGTIDFNPTDQFASYDTGGTPESFISLVMAKVAIDPDKKYIATVKVKTPAATQFATDPCIFKMVTIGVVPLVTTWKTAANARDTWTTITFQFTTVGGGITFHSGDILKILFYIVPGVYGTDHLAADGELFIDQFEVYEYIDVAGAPCTLAIDIPTTTVSTSSGIADGSIQIGITGGTAPFQYSKDDGATWQGSNIFAGLLPGIYNCKVQDADGCIASDVFTVNLAGGGVDFTTSVVDESVVGANDGQISVTPTVGIPPYTYSKDSGATYQPSNLFTDLAPGTYRIALKDSTGSAFARNVIVHAGLARFENIWFSRNHIFYPASAEPGWGALNNVRIFNEVTLDKNSDGTFSSIPFKVDLPPDVDGNVIFYNREAFTDTLKAVPPALNADEIIRLTDRIKTFKNNTCQLQDDQVDPPGATTPSTAHLVLLGGLSKLAWASIDFFIDYLPTNKKFLTWAPVIKPVDRAQEDYLNYFVFNLTTATLQLQVKAYYDDGTNETSIITTLAGVQYGQLYQIPAGPANTGAALINPAKNLLKYDLSLLDQDDSLISEVRTYVLDIVSHPRKRLFMLLNSLGSYEVLRFTGVVEKGAVITKTEVAKFLPHTYNALDGEREMNDVTLRESNSISSGLKDMTAAWLDYMQDLLLSRKFFEVTDGQRIPLMIQPGTFPMGADQNFEYFIRFIALGAYEDENYTPKNI